MRAVSREVAQTEVACGKRHVLHRPLNFRTNGAREIQPSEICARLTLSWCSCDPRAN